MRLQDTFRVVLRGRDVVNDGLEQGLKVLVVRCGAVVGLHGGGAAQLAGCVNNGNVQDGVEVQVRNFVSHVRSQAQQQVHGLGNNFVDAGIGAVGLVDQQDYGELCSQCLTQHEAGLRQRALRGINEQNNAVNHGQTALDFATEVGVAGVSMTLMVMFRPLAEGPL